MNNLYEFGGSCNVIIRCNSERTIGNKKYSVGEPYTVLEDVYVSFDYATHNSESNAKKNILATREGMPTNIRILNVELTEKVCDLITTRIGVKTVSKIYDAIAENGEIYLPEAPLADGIYVFYRNDLVTDLEVNGDKLISSSFVDDERYKVFYNVAASSPCFELNTPHYGYFTLEVLGKGNTDKSTQDVYIKLPACSLMSTPVFDMVRGAILNAPLSFTCIAQNQEEPYYTVGG